MKKNISINISGIIFHIEEDGYEKLKNYLESINRYFSSFDDSLEIISDIESRIAEIFLSKLKEGRQVVSLEDVEELIATMGSIKDFQAADEESAYMGAQEAPKDKKAEPGEPLFSKRLYRDNNKKLVGGVLAGIGYYFSIDPLWTRLLYILLFFGVSILPSIAGFLFLAYIVLWIVVPGSNDLKEEKKIKKMYRDPDGKVLGGVASGVAAYFGIDVVVVRLLLFVSIFFAGTGLILYIILWIILPEAKTLTDKMEMQGQPVTLSNIESNIRKSLNMKEGHENLLVKILLFPFRLIAAFFAFLSRSMGPLMAFFIEAVRVVVGVILAIIGISGLLAILMAFGILLGIFTGNDMNFAYPWPLELIKNDLQLLPAIAIGLALLIPALVIALLGFMIIMKRKVLNAGVGWILLALWLISVAFLGYYIPKYIRGFTEESRSTTAETYALAGKTIILKGNDTGEDDFELVDFRIRSHEDSVVRVEKQLMSRGTTRIEAEENAQKIQYNILVTDSVFSFDTDFQLAEGSKFRKQEVEVTVYLPYGQLFLMDESLKPLLGSFMYRQGFSTSLASDNQWVFNDQGLKCVTCPPEESLKEVESDWNIDGYQKTFDMDDFSEIDIQSAFKVQVMQDDEFEVIAAGNKSDVNDVVVEKIGSKLKVRYTGKLMDIGDKPEKITIFLKMPDVQKAEFSGAVKAYIEGFENLSTDLELHGAAYVEMEGEAEYIKASLDGASKLQLSGNGNRLETKIMGASTLNAFDFEAKEVEVSTYSASTANVHATEVLIAKTFGASTVNYKGEARVEIEKSGNSTVRKE